MKGSDNYNNWLGTKQITKMGLFFQVNVCQQQVNHKDNFAPLFAFALP